MNLNKYPRSTRKQTSSICVNVLVLKNEYFYKTLLSRGKSFPVNCMGNTRTGGKYVKCIFINFFHFNVTF